MGEEGNEARTRMLGLLREAFLDVSDPEDAEDQQQKCKLTQANDERRRRNLSLAD